MSSKELPQHNRMRILVRAVMGFLGVALAVIAVALYFRWPVVSDFWPWTGYNSGLSPLSFYFLSSIAAAISAPILWIAITDKLHAAGPGAINLLLSFVGIGVFMFQGYAADPGNARLLI